MIINSETVGLENLPNVFIDNIKVLTLFEYKKKVVITTCIYDEIPHTWRGRESNIDIVMTVITDNSVIDKVNSGTHVENLGLNESYFISTKSADSASEVLTTNTLYKKYKQTFEFEINIDEDPNVNVYCHCSIPGANFGIKEFDIYCGPIVGEQIYRSSTLVDLSGYFYDPNTNEEYGGPVCSEGGKYYKGSYKSETSEEIFYASEDNMKIRASRMGVSI